MDNLSILFLEQVTEGDAVDMVETAIGHHSSDLTTRSMCLVSLLKLSSRFPSCSKYVQSVLFFFSHPLKTCYITLKKTENVSLTMGLAIEDFIHLKTNGFN